MIEFRTLFGMSLGFSLDKVTDFNYQESEKNIKYIISLELLFWSFEFTLRTVTKPLSIDDWASYKRMKGEINND